MEQNKNAYVPQTIDTNDIVLPEDLMKLAKDLYREGLIDFCHPACEGERKRAYCLIRKAANMGLPQAKEMISDDTKFDFDTESVWRSYLSSIESMKNKTQEASNKGTSGLPQICIEPHAALH